MVSPAIPGTRDAVLHALKSSAHPLDSYEVAKHARITPMQAARCLQKLAREGAAATDDPLDTTNDLSARFRVVDSAMH